jgi:hypothetical protein
MVGMFGEVGTQRRPVSSQTIPRVQPAIGTTVSRQGRERNLALIHFASSPGVSP